MFLESYDVRNCRVSACVAVHLTNICDHLSENPHSLHKHVYWQNLKIICEIMHATGKYLQGLMGPAISEGSYIPSYLPGYGEFKNLCFISVAWMVSVSHAFVYNVVNVNKIATTFLAKPPP